LPSGEESKYTNQEKLGEGGGDTSESSTEKTSILGISLFFFSIQIRYAITYQRAREN
jgi:hypothetical protein